MYTGTTDDESPIATPRIARPAIRTPTLVAPAAIAVPAMNTTAAAAISTLRPIRSPISIAAPAPITAPTSTALTTTLCPVEPRWKLRLTKSKAPEMTPVS